MSRARRSATALGARLRRRAIEAAQREREAAALAAIAALLLERADVQGQLHEISSALGRALGSGRAWIELGSLRRPEPGESAVDLAVGERHVGRLFLDESLRLGSETQQRLLPAVASLLAVAQDREQLARAAPEAEALRRSDEAKAAVLRAVGDGLRPPLREIREACERYAEQPLDEAGRRFVFTLLEQIERLELLDGNLLDLARLHEGAAPAQPEEWEPEALLRRVRDALGAAAERVSVRLADALPAVHVDAVQIERALVNVVESALEGSERVEVAVEAAGREVLVRVTEETCGGNGGGLGLAIAYGLVCENGGRVFVEPGADGGAVLVVALPTRGSATGTASSARAPATGRSAPAAPPR